MGNIWDTEAGTISRSQVLETSSNWGQSREYEKKTYFRGNTIDSLMRDTDWYMTKKRKFILYLWKSLEGFIILPSCRE